MVTSSDSEDDEIDAAKLAALRSVAIDSSAVIQNASAPVASLRKSGNGSLADAHASDDEDGKDLSGGLKLYQTRLQDLLYKHLDKTFEASTGGDHLVAPAKKNSQSSSKPDGDERSGGGIRLFRRAPPGIVVQPREERMLGPGVKPQLRPSLTVNEDSEEHLFRLQATVVDSETVAEQAKRLREKVLASAKASQAKAELSRTKEAERVAQLKRERGEEWLPSVAVQMAKEAANEPKLAPKVAPAIVEAPDGSTDAPSKKKKRKKKISKAQQLGVVLD